HVSYECPMLGTNANNNPRLAVNENERTKVPETEETSSRNRPTVDINQAQAMLANYYLEKREVDEFSVTVGGKTISSCAVMTDAGNYAIIKECKLMIHDGRKKIRIPTEYCKPININERIEKKEKLTKVKKEPEEDMSTLEEETKLESDESDSDKEYEEEVLSSKLYLYWELQEDKGDSVWCPEYKTVYLNKKKEKEDFNIGPMMDKQEEHLRAILLKYKGTFQEESGQLGKTSIAQHEIYTKNGAPVKQKFYSTSRSEISRILQEIHEEFCKNCGSLVQLLKKQTSFKWGNAQQNAFEKLKIMLTTAPVLAHPDDNKEYILYTDVSHLALGDILAQLDEHKKEHIIEYASRSTSLAKRNYTITELECTTIGWASQAQYYMTQEEILYRANTHDSLNPLKVIQQKKVRVVLEALYKSAIGGHLGEKQRGKLTTHEPLYPIKPAQIFDKIGIDFVGPLPKTKKSNKYLIVATEFVTKWPEVQALPNYYLKESRALARENIKRSQGKQVVEHNTQYQLQSFIIKDKVSHYIRARQNCNSRSELQNLPVYLQDLNQEELDNLVLPLKGPEEDWDKKLAYACQKILNLNTQRKLNSQILEAYYKLGALLAEK
ncbi:22130_t:CDS:10, partial [Gigaspora margarita]